MHIRHAVLKFTYFSRIGVDLVVCSIQPLFAMMLRNMFWAHGKFCASHPWEVIIGTLTVTLCLMSMTMYSSDDKICGWNYVCPNVQKLHSFDTLGVNITQLAMMSQCLAIMYLYFHFRDLKKMGSRYLLAISGLFTMFSSFMFSLAVVNLFKNDYTGLKLFTCSVQELPIRGTYYHRTTSVLTTTC